MWSTKRPGVATTMSARQRKPSLQEATAWHTYVFWTRLSCSLASDFCPVTKATLRGVVSV